MRFARIECPVCAETGTFYLTRDEASHLRRCDTCHGWFIIGEGPTADAHSVAVETVTSLGEPPACPLPDCGATVANHELPHHIIDQHDGSLQDAISENQV